MTLPQPCTACRCRVVKVGGSLLNLPGLWRVLTCWLDRQPALDTVMIVGGGELADSIRQLDRQYGLAEESAHWLSIRAMNLNGFVLSRLIPGATWVSGFCDWCDGQRDPERAPRRWHFMAAEYFLRREEPVLPGVRLPIGWHVTSDSIAARLAEVCQAHELVLLKSTVPTADGLPMSSVQAGAAGFVDRHFPASAAPLRRIRVVNLRDASFAETSLTT